MPEARPVPRRHLGGEGVRGDAQGPSRMERSRKSCTPETHRVSSQTGLGRGAFWEVSPGRPEGQLLTFWWEVQTRHCRWPASNRTGRQTRSALSAPASGRCLLGGSLLQARDMAGLRRRQCGSPGQSRDKGTKGQRQASTCADVCLHALCSSLFLYWKMEETGFWLLL